MMKFKKDLIESVNKLESIINDFDFVTKHSLFYLDEYFDKIRNQIDIQREELLLKVEKFSRNALQKVDEFYGECVYNLEKMEIDMNEKNASKLKQYNHDLAIFKQEIDDLNDNEEPKKDKLFKIRVDIDKKIIKNKLELDDYKSIILSRKIFLFEPILFNLETDPFGKLILIDDELKLSENVGKCIKAFSNNVGDELLNNKYFDLCMEILDISHIAMGNNRGNIKVWNLQSSQCVKILNGHKKEVYCLKKISNDEIASGSRDFNIKLWNLKANSCTKTLIGHQKPVLSLDILKEKMILISGSADKTIKLWNLNEKNDQVVTCMDTINCDFGMCISLKLTPCDKLVSASYEDHSLKIWNLKSFQCESSITYNSLSYICYDIMSNSNIITMTKTKPVKIWDITTGECLKIFDYIQTANAIEIKLISDEYLLIIYENNDEDRIDYQIFTYKLWQLVDEGKCVKTFKGYKYDGSFYGLEFLPDRRLVFCTDQFVRLMHI